MSAYDWNAGEDKPGNMSKAAKEYNPVLFLRVIKSGPQGNRNIKWGWIEFKTPEGYTMVTVSKSIGDGSIK